jgi:hypothetical protein
LIVFSLPSPSYLPFFRSSRRSRRQREGLCFNLDKHPTKRSYSPVEVGRLGLLQIGEEAPDPGGKMLLEQFAVGASRKPKRPLASPAMISHRIAA